MAIRSAVVSTDPAFRDFIRHNLGPQAGVAGGFTEITVPYRELTEDQLSTLRQAGSDVIVLDLTDDPELGLKFAQFLTERSPDARLIAAGPLLPPDLLMAAIRAGVVDYLQKPVTDAALQQALARALQRLGKAKADPTAQKTGKLYTVFSPKGGAGSTIFAVNLAVTLHRQTEQKTLLVDLDLELGDSASMLGIQPRFNFVDFVENFRRMDAGLLASYIERHSSGIHVLSAPYQPDKAQPTTADQLRRIFTFLREHYDYIVVDMPRSFSASTIAVLESADLLFILATVDLPSLRNVQRVLPLLTRVLPQGEDQVRLVVNRYNPDDAISLNDVRHTLGFDVFATLANEYEAVMESVNTTKPIVLGGPSQYALDIRTVAARLTGMPLPEQGKRGVLGKLTGALRRQRVKAPHNPEQAYE
jgi:pilus assembly protein CpaE